MSRYLQDFLQELESKKAAKPPVETPAAPSAVGGSRRKAPAAAGEAELKGFAKRFMKDRSIEVSWIHKKVPYKTTIPEMVVTPTTLLNKSVIFYGGSGSGKTFLINHFLYHMRNVFPMVEIFAPTNDQNHSYDGKVPNILIFTKFGLEHIRNTYARQQFASSVYDIARQVPILHNIFLRVQTPITRDVLARKKACHAKELSELETSTLSPSQKKAEREAMTSRHKDELITFYKEQIDLNISKLVGRSDLSEEEQIAIQYRNLVPNLLNVFDDTATEMKQLLALGKQQRNDTISDYFFKGRHAHITHFYVFQDDAKLDSAIRKNAFYSIFTSKQTALGFFKRAANDFTADFQAQACAVIEAVLYPFNEDGTVNHKKLVFDRVAQKFMYVIAEDHEDFRMCSEAVWKFCTAADAGGQKLDKQNPYYQRFVPKTTGRPVMPSHRNYPPG